MVCVVVDVVVPDVALPLLLRVVARALRREPRVRARRRTPRLRRVPAARLVVVLLLVEVVVVEL